MDLNLNEIIRIGLTTFGSFIVAMVWTPLLTNFLYKYKVAQQIRDKSWDNTDVPVYKKFHEHKAGTPTMGGLLVWVTAAVLTLIFNFDRTETWLPLFVLVTTGILGAVDDVLNMRGKSAIKGLGAKPKFFWLILLSGLGAYWFFYRMGFDVLHIPAVGDFHIGAWYIPFFMFVVIGTANAVNITDGLDGLAGGLLGIAFSAFGAIAFFQGQLHLAAFCGAIVGALVTFLWFNINPARFFMGDTGAFALGSTLAVVALLTNSAVVLVVIGLLFVIEASSSMLQIFSKKVFKKKIFVSAPLHHHLQAKGWTEPKIVMRFWLLGAILAVIGTLIGIIGGGVR
ncbi:MAG TPA: phospho-N-acetylmuramoyl-pentapeptide-transferase [Patescibacteria group bacterium]|nr:phospho-N-acetylmuramoyl-pentapeptide-transferase [Patescibacteria group bacterium]